VPESEWARREGEQNLRGAEAATSAVQRSRAIRVGPPPRGHVAAGAEVELEAGSRAEIRRGHGEITRSQARSGEITGDQAAWMDLEARAGAQEWLRHEEERSLDNDADSKASCEAGPSNQSTEAMCEAQSGNQSIKASCEAHQPQRAVGSALRWGTCLPPLFLPSTSSPSSCDGASTYAGITPRTRESSARSSGGSALPAHPSATVHVHNGSVHLHDGSTPRFDGLGRSLSSLTSSRSAGGSSEGVPIHAAPSSSEDVSQETMELAGAGGAAEPGPQIPPAGAAANPRDAPCLAQADSHARATPSSGIVSNLAAKLNPVATQSGETAPPIQPSPRGAPSSPRSGGIVSNLATKLNTLSGQSGETAPPKSPLNWGGLALARLRSSIGKLRDS